MKKIHVVVLRIFFILTTLLSIVNSAYAVPSFFRQTGLACAACHVGGFGPHLTDFGVYFKLSGYTFSKDDTFRIPIAGMVIASVTGTSNPATNTDANLKNKQLSLDQASLFFAGKLSQQAGIFSQVTYDGIIKKSSIDQSEIRIANTFSVNNHTFITGLTVNNTPGMSDPYNSLPAWGFPFISSAIAPTPTEASLLDGLLSLRVVGITGYTQIDGKWFGELGTYRSLSQNFQSTLGLGSDADPGVVHGSLYGRFARHENFSNHSVSGGLTYFSAAIQSDRNSAAQIIYKDIATDLHYHWKITDTHTLTLLGNLIYEQRDVSDLLTNGNAQKNKLHYLEHTISSSYYWKNSYGITYQRFGLIGSSDNIIYATGFANSTPNFAGSRIQIDWTPFGTKQPSTTPSPQLRLGLQYTRYDKFDGGKINYDGLGRNASYNNNLMLFAWTLF